MDVATGVPDVDVMRILDERKSLGLPRGNAVVRTAVDQERRTDCRNLREVVVTVARQAAHRKGRKALRGDVDNARERRLQDERINVCFQRKLHSDP